MAQGCLSRPEHLATRSEALPTIPGTFSDLPLLEVDRSRPALGLIDLHDPIRHPTFPNKGIALEGKMYFLAPDER